MGKVSKILLTAAAIVVASSGIMAGGIASGLLNAPALKEEKKPPQVTMIPQYDGYDLVSYFQEGGPRVGNLAYNAVVDGKSYAFATEENLSAFSDNPEKYLPQYAGNCALGMVYGKKSKANPTSWKVVDGRLFLLLNSGTKKLWEKKLPKNISKADRHWVEHFEG